MVDYEVKYENPIHDAIFRENGVIFEKVGNVTEEKRIIPPFVIKNGEKKPINKETYDYLRSKGILLTKKEKEDVDKLRKEYEVKKYDRKDYDAEPTLISDEKKKKIFNYLPFVV